MFAMASPIAQSGVAMFKSLYEAGITATTGLQPSPNISQHSNAIALLICEFFGGHVPAEVAAPSSVSIKVALGKSSASRQCYEAVYGESVLDEGVEQVIERLAMSGWDAQRIASVVDGNNKLERVPAINRIMRRRLGWNLELLQRICVPVQPADIAHSEPIIIELLAKGKSLAVGCIPPDEVLSTTSVRCRRVVYCSGVQDDYKVALDVDARMFALVKRDSDESSGPRMMSL